MNTRAQVKPEYLIIVIKKEKQYTKPQQHYLSSAKLPKTTQEYNFYYEEYNSSSAPVTVSFDFHMYYR